MSELVEQSKSMKNNNKDNSGVAAITKPSRATSQDRMSTEERRHFIIDIALEILREEGAAGVNMGEVAQRAQVTRTLVYKHFANRSDLINETYRREAAKLHETIRSQIDEAIGFENRMRAFVFAVLGAIDSHGWMFSPMEPQTHEQAFLSDQGQRDRKAVRYFAQLACDEFGLSLKETTSAMGILLSGIASFRLQAHVLTSQHEREFLAELYLDIVMAALVGLTDRSSIRKNIKTISASNIRYGSDD